MSHFKHILFILFLVFASWNANARIVTSDNDVRQAYEKLISCGVVGKPFYAQRQWTEQSIKKAVEQIDDSIIQKSHCSREDVDFLVGQIKHFSSFPNLNTSTLKHPSTTLRAGLHTSPPVLQAGIEYVSGGTSSFPYINWGTIDATKNPLLENERSQMLGLGVSPSLAVEQSIFLNDHELFLRPRFDVLFHDDANTARATLEQGYALWNGKKINMVLGRAPLVWGQGEYGGLIFTENARPLDHFLMTNANPIALPWFLEHLGRFKFSYVLGNLGPDQDHPWDFFMGLELGYKPSSWFEFTLGHVIQFGGENSTSMSFGDTLQEFLGFIPGISQSKEGGANKITEANLRFFIDPWMGLQTYLDYACDDSNTRSLAALKKHFTHNSSWKLGLYSTRFLNSVADSLRAEFVLTAPIAYRHSEFANGWTENGYVIGDALGPDGKRIALEWSHDWRKRNHPWTSTLTTAWEMTDNYWYNVPATGYNVIATSMGPRENRYIIHAAHKFYFEHLSLKADLAFMHRVNADYVDEKSTNDVRVGAMVEVPFDR